nr:hypothetical protein [Micromonospora sp. DSM 115978]
MMIRPAAPPMIALLAALLTAATATAVPAHAAPPGADREPATRLATIPFESNERYARFHDANRSGLVVGVLGDTWRGDPVLWRRYDNPIPIEVSTSPDWPMRLNDRGHLAGTGGAELDGAAWLRRPSGTTYLRWPGRVVRVTDLNDRDQVIGGLVDPAGEALDQPFRWHKGQFTLLEVPAGMNGVALQINSRGDALGELLSADGTTRMPVVWRGTTMSVLSPPDDGFVQAYDINDRGQVVGTYSLDGWGRSTRPFRWQRGRFVDLLPGRPDSVGGAFAINESGEIAGSVDNRAVLWRGGRIIDLGVEGRAEVINERGDVAGMHFVDASPDDVTAGAYRWRNGRLLHSQYVFGPVVEARVHAIDDRGRVVGHLYEPYPSRTTGFLDAWIPDR